MEYSVEELAAAAGISVDTVRYYQSRGLLQSPQRRGRCAVYQAGHLQRLQDVRALADDGLSLKLISKILAGQAQGGGSSVDKALSRALHSESDEPTLSAEALSKRLGIPRSLLRSLETSGLAEAAETAEGDRRYSQSDLSAARAALKLLDYGFPLTRLLSLAVRHDRSVRTVVDEAIDLFDDHVRKPGGEQADADEVVRAFQEILPQVTMLVGRHFERVLVNRALKRLKKSGDRGSLKTALNAARSGRSRVA